MDYVYYSVAPGSEAEKRILAHDAKAKAVYDSWRKFFKQFKELPKGWSFALGNGRPIGFAMTVGAFQWVRAHQEAKGSVWRFDSKSGFVVLVRTTPEGKKLGAAMDALPHELNARSFTLDLTDGRATCAVHANRIGSMTLTRVPTPVKGVNRLIVGVPHAFYMPDRDGFNNKLPPIDELLPSGLVELKQSEAVVLVNGK